MERVISGRSDMEAFAKELRQGEIKEYKIKFEKTGSYYKIDKERLDAYLNGGNEKKFYDEIGPECDFIPNPYYVEKAKEVAEFDEFDEFDDVKPEEPAVNEEWELAKVEQPELFEQASQTEVPQPQEAACEHQLARIVELENEIEVLKATHDDQIRQILEGHETVVDSLNVEISRKSEEVIGLVAQIDSLKEKETALLELIEEPVNMAEIKFEELVAEIARRGFNVELKYDAK